MSKVIERKLPKKQRPLADPKTARAFARDVERALATGAHLEARQIADQGHRLYPDDQRLATMAAVLAPPRILETGLPPDPSIIEDHRWIRENVGKYPGQWVAIKDGRLLGVGKTIRELREGKDLPEGVLFTKVG